MSLLERDSLPKHVASSGRAGQLAAESMGDSGPRPSGARNDPTLQYLSLRAYKLAADLYTIASRIGCHCLRIFIDFFSVAPIVANYILGTECRHSSALVAQCPCRLPAAISAHTMRWASLLR
eukprot:6189294-Pleurochrysis_carterae.AAC.1